MSLRDSNLQQLLDLSRQIIAGGGHAVQMEAPEAVADTMLELLKR